MKLNKQNCFDDFIAAGEWLIDNKYTSTPKLAIAGVSNGALLVAGCVTQRPELFGAVYADSGLYDMLRYQKMPNSLGSDSISEFGSADNSVEEFRALYAYSPYHRALKQPGTKYPPILLYIGANDNRVGPGNTYKFAAALQAGLPSNAGPVLMVLDPDSGHAGSTTETDIAKTTIRYQFLTRELGMRVRSRASEGFIKAVAGQ
jgi:prolyl oligopeptidase